MSATTPFIIFRFAVIQEPFHGAAAWRGFSSLKIRRKECDSNFRGASKPVHGSANRNTIGAPGFLSIQKPEGRQDITPTYGIGRGEW
jgi:hypothetical protein